MKPYTLTSLIILTISAPAIAFQTPPQIAAPEAAAPSAPSAPTPTAVILSNPDENVLRTGHPITLRMMETLSTKGKKLRPGYRFNMEVAEPVTLNGQLVIPAGSPAVGEITDVRNKGMWGKSGKINARVLYARVGDHQIRLTGQFDDKGVAGTAGVVSSVVLMPLAGFFLTGTSAHIDTGSIVNAFLDEDIRIAPATAPTASSLPGM